MDLFPMQNAMFNLVTSVKIEWQGSMAWKLEAFKSDSTFYPEITKTPYTHEN